MQPQHLLESNRSTSNRTVQIINEHVYIYKCGVSYILKYDNDEFRQVKIMCQTQDIDYILSNRPILKII